MDAVQAFQDVVAPEDLNDTFAVRVAALGFGSFAGGCVRSAENAASMFLMRWPPAWLEEYLANGYAADDPIIPRAMASPNPFHVDDLRLTEADPGWRPVAAAKAFGWRTMFVVPIHGPDDDRGLVCLASLDNVPVGRRQDQLVDLSSQAYWRGLELRASRQPLHLTPRERQALVLVSKGLSDSEIGTSMGISKHTAHLHIENAKRRLGVKSRAQAVASALKRKLI